MDNNDKTISLKHLQKLIRDLSKRPRSHADFYYFNDNFRVEIAVVTELLSYGLYDGNLQELELIENDPPDIAVRYDNGQHVIGIEVMELVSSKSINLQIKADRQKTGNLRDNEEYFMSTFWSDNQVTKQILECIKTKAKKITKNISAGYDEIVLALHTAEPDLKFPRVQKLVDEESFKSECINLLKEINRVFIVFKYDSSTKKTPILQVH